ncbi:MAG: MBOAT family protein [Clostridia bacterium]|nr:MBOAT family protein [Clostridia bacterium]
MLFNSIQFAVFLPIVFALYWIIPYKFRWILLLAASYWFYMSWKPEYVVLILTTTIISYTSALLMENKPKKIKKYILTASAVICLGILFFFKYFNFFAEFLCGIIGIFTRKPDPIVLNLILPVGISFYTFQTLSYVIDVYKGTSQAERHLGKYAAFISFFPQLVAGPIERTNNLLPQIKAHHVFDYDKATYGLKIMAWGFFKKIAVADVLSLYTGQVFGTPEKYRGFSLVLAALMFTLQIYCDFSGYSDIAVGTAKLFGIDLMTNFKSPYFSQSIHDFWNRWHISLSTWFRDYVYIPLGGNRCSKFRHAFNLIVTFLVSGLWHGANYTFIIWGGIHGLGQTLENILISKENRESIGYVKWLRIFGVFTFSTIAWIFFASSSLNDALYIITHLFDGVSDFAGYLKSGFDDLNFKNQLLLVSITVLGFFDYYSLKKDVISVISSKKKNIRWAAYVLLVLWTLFNIQTTESDESMAFIYFQF